MYDKFFGDHYYESNTSKKQVRVHSSTFSTGEVGLVAINISDKREILKIKLENIVVGKKAGVYELYNKDPNSRKTGVNGEFTESNAGGPDYLTKIKANMINIDRNSFNIELRPYSSYYILIEKK
jgi:hypothetical protein